MKKILSFVLAFVLLFTSGISVSAADTPSRKEEVVYGILKLDGSINNLYLVNIFNGGAITDYGDYSDIRNMTTSQKLSQKGDQITINTTADKFYYQGTLEKKELPWDINIKYFLDDKEISGTELAGKSGKLKITASVKQNNKVNSTFFDNYALQIALSLDNKLCSNIKANNATVAEAGSKKQLTYTVLPGNGIDITVTADVRDFEMEAITINGIKLSLGINFDSAEFTGQISELANAIKGLDEGATVLLNGLTQLSNGMQKYVDGMKAFNEGLGQLSVGADKLNIGAAALTNGLSQLTKQNSSLINGALAIQQATFDSVNAQLTKMGLGLPVLTPENYTTVLSQVPDLAVVKKQLDGAVQFTQGLKSYTDGVTQLGKGASELASGTSEFKSSSSVIATSANELYNAGSELNAAIKNLRDGLASYKDGTNKLRHGTSGMDSKINDKVDEMLDSISGKGDKVISFVSDKNTKVSAVQFVLKTDSINIQEIQKSVASKPVELSLWQKLLKLFSFINNYND
jgi:putative membrane protein